MAHARLEMEPSPAVYRPGCPAVAPAPSLAPADAPLDATKDTPKEAAQELGMIEATVAQVFGVHTRELQGLNRGRAPVALARQVAMYLTHVVFSVSLSDTGQLYQRDRTTVAHACGVVEDLRDDPIFDRVLELLEGVVQALIGPRRIPVLAFN